MFEKEKYNNYINTLQATIIIKNAVIILAIIIITIISQKYFTILFSILVGILTSIITTFKTKIRIQEMYWKLDLYNKFIKED